MSRENLAEAAGISPETVNKLERGERRPSYPMMLRLAAALGAEVADLTGPGNRPPDGGRSAVVLALRDALLSPEVIPGLPSDPPPAAQPEEKLRARIAAAQAAYWAGEFGKLGRQIPGLIRTVRASRAAGVPRAGEHLALADDLAAALLVHLGKEDLAGLAAERAITAATWAGGDQMCLMMRGTYAWALLHQGRLREAEEIAADAAAAAAGMSPGRDGRARARHAAVRGVLLMTAVGPAAAAGQDVSGYLAEAADDAGRAGGPVRLYGTVFSASSVRMQAAYAHAVGRRPGDALREARRVRLEDLPGTISRGRHLLDVAQAYADDGDYGEATGILAQAQRMAPAWFTRQGVARVLIGELLERQQRLSGALKELAEAVNASAPREYAPYFRLPG